MDRREGTVLMGTLLTPRFAPTALSLEGTVVLQKTTHFLYDLFQTGLVDDHIDTIEQYLKFQYTSFTVISTPHQSNPDTTTSHLQRAKPESLICCGNFVIL